jgi:hypothetical protein
MRALLSLALACMCLASGQAGHLLCGVSHRQLVSMSGSRTQRTKADVPYASPSQADEDTPPCGPEPGRDQAVGRPRPGLAGMDAVTRLGVQPPATGEA